MKSSQELINFKIIPQLENLELLHATYYNHSFSKHMHEGYAIGVIERGALKFSYRGENIIAPAGHINLAIPAEAHDGYAASEEGWTYRMFYFKPQTLKRAATEITGRRSDFPFFKAGTIEDNWLANKIQRFHILLQESRLSLIEQESYLLEMLTQFILRHSNDRFVTRNLGKENQAVKQICDYIESNYSADISISMLSRICNLSPFHLIRVFNNKVGIPPHAYLIQVRVKKARELLLQGYKPAYASYETGFVDQSHLTRHFKRITGITPGKYSNIVQECYPLG
ncbi:MAG: AraC family transcriptional regulator [Firmicutes bacterium]|nr:AraC family transcriptional regulator [Bacillota bacterium]